MASFSFSTTRSILCEPGCSSQLGEMARGLGIERLLIATDAGIAATGIMDIALNSLSAAGISVAIFKGVVADPPESVIQEALSLAEQVNADGVCGFGGGSSMDVAKLVALLRASGETLAAVYGVGNAKGSRLPLIQVPNTACTGSEVTPIAIVTTGETTKQGVVAPQLLPDLALLDADLTLGLPSHVTAATGIDAMVHAIEAYTSKLRKNPYSDMLAREALRLISANIVDAALHGSNRVTRSNMLFGAMLAGQAFANAPVAAVHALAYPLGGHYHISHGLSNSLVLPEVMRFNLPACAPLYAELSTAVDAGLPPTGEALIAHMESLIEQVGLPRTLAEVDVPEKDLPMLASDAMLQQRLLVNNPREVTEADALQIYQAVYR
ncbi:MAG: iron-containing alcohol dehydrogenase [Ketobacteraceae bacterium]|nr:iron-containing alcohol dehydrogenase [Ketobacteraceae bacterium]